VVGGCARRYEAVIGVAVPEQRRAQLAIGPQLHDRYVASGRSATWRCASTCLAQNHAAGADRCVEPGLKAERVVTGIAIVAKRCTGQSHILIGAVESHCRVAATECTRLT